MRAITLEGYGQPEDLRLAEVEPPQVGDADVLVRVMASSVNMADLDYALGRPWPTRFSTGLRKPKNPVQGTDVAGVVEAVGPAVSRFSPGDEVWGDLTDAGLGAWADYAIATESTIAPMPRDVTFEEAAAIPSSAMLALQGLQAKRPITPGQHVLINGACGNVGPFAIQIAKAAGAEITAVDAADKLDVALEVGADHVIDFESADYTAGGVRYDRILDAAAFRGLRQSRRALTDDGTYVMVGGPFLRFMQVGVASVYTALGRQKVGIPAWKPFHEPDVPTLTELVEDGDVRPWIHRRYPLEQTAEACRSVEDGRSKGKVVITVAS